MAWDWKVFCKETTTGDVIAGCFGKGGDQTYLNWILSAWGWTLTVALSALVVALVAGLVMGTLRTLPDNPWLVRLANAWVELFRNIPLLVQIFLWYFVVPAVFPAMKDVPSEILVILALGFFTSARVAEQVRSGIQALPRGQRYAGMALGLAFAVSVAELTFFARQSGEETSQPVEMYLAVTLLYAVSAFVINRIMGFIERKSRVPGFVAAGGMSVGH